MKDINNILSTDYPFSIYDRFNDIAMEVLNNSEIEYEYTAKLEAVKLLHFVATTVSRFNSQDRIEELISNRVDPLIENILNGEY